jgi:hypothetical protein
MNRTPTSGNGNVDPDEPTVVHDRTLEFELSYDPAGTDGKHRHGDGQAHLHKRGDEPHWHKPDDGAVVFFDTPADDRPQDGWFGSVSRADQPADPAPASSVASAGPRPRDGGDAAPGRPTSLVRDSRGRFTPKPTIPPMSAGLAQALLDASAEAWRVDNATRTAGVLVAAVAFDDHVRHDGEEAS